MSRGIGNTRYFLSHVVWKADLNLFMEEFKAIFLLMQTLLNKQSTKRLNLLVVDTFEGLSSSCSYTSMLIGFGKSLRQEHPQCRLSVVEVEQNLDLDLMVTYVQRELVAPLDAGTHIRYREDQSRCVETYELISAETINVFQSIPSPLRQGGVYLITGGLGGLGFIVAEYLAKNYHAKLILTGRSLLDEGRQLQLKQLQILGVKCLYL